MLDLFWYYQALYFLEKKQTKKESNNSREEKMKNVLSRIISTGLGVGYFPVAPGTMGSLEAVLIYWFSPPIALEIFATIILAVTLIGVISSSITEKEVREKSGDSELHDPGIIVIDEIAGMFFALLFIPKSLILVSGAFVLFRFFDIVKPFPVKNLERLPSGWGIMLDDIAAGIMANLLLQLIIMIFNLR